MAKIRIDPEFRDKIPSMPKEDFDGLRADILRDGYVRDPLVVWKEENTLLDGHHRWTVICENWELLKDKYTIVYMSFPDRWAAIAWICANQLHKHNMSEIQRMKLIQEEHDARQKTSGGQVGNKNAQKQGGEIHHLVSDEPEVVKRGSEGKELKTRPTIAKEHGITEAKVKTSVEVGRGIDRAAEIDLDFKREVLTEEIKPTYSDLSSIRSMESDEEVKAAIETLRKGERLPKRNRKTTVETENDRKAQEQIESIVSEMYDTTTVAEYTIEMMVEDVQLNSEAFFDLMRNTFTEHSTLLTKENKPIVANEIQKIIDKFIKLKGIVEK